ncbi:UNVERIFIED_ORG: hypothetical protein ABIB52_000709 [Arthrobacter sp. UYCu721]
MSFTQSPNTGDLGRNSPGSQAVRLLKSEFAPLEAIMVDRSQLPSTPLEDWAFEAVATRDPKAPIPKLTLGADLSSRFDVDFLDAKFERVGGFVFDESHPDAWWDAVHANGQLLIYVGDVNFLLKATTRDEQFAVVQKSHIGWAPLAVRAYPNGVGTAAPGQ